MKIPEDWKSAWTTLSDYWRLYGGLRAIARSPYMIISLVFTIVFGGFWQDDDKLFDAASQIMPGLLGFSIGAFAIVLVFSSDRIIKIIAENGNSASVLLQTSAMFVHFIVSQVLTLLILFASAAFKLLLWVSFFMVTYSLLMAIATSFALFNLAQIYNASMRDIDDKND